MLASFLIWKVDTCNDPTHKTNPSNCSYMSLLVVWKLGHEDLVTSWILLDTSPLLSFQIIAPHATYPPTL